MATYRVVDPFSGETLVEGSAKACAKRVGCSAENIRKAGKEGRNVCNKMRVLIVGEEVSLWEQWDEFAAAMRKKYGVPVKHLELNTRGKGKEHSDGE